MSNHKTLLVGIAGGSGSGKTTFCDRLAAEIGPDALVLSSDHYYRSLDDMSPADRALVNFDHPDSIDLPLLRTHLKMLSTGETIQVPQYDFKTHLRGSDTTTVTAKPIVLVEGVLVLADRQLFESFDVTIFVDAKSETRLARRIQRDVVDRRRSEQSVRNQWAATVAPMYAEFVRPCKRMVDIIVNGEASSDIAMKLVAAGLQSKIA